MGRKGRGAAGIVAKSLLHKTDTGKNGQFGVQFPWALAPAVALALACLSQQHIKPKPVLSSLCSQRNGIIAVDIRP